MIRIATVNVNGIRAAAKRDFASWLQQRSCDIIAIQEMRCPPKLVPAEITENWQVCYDPGSLAGRNGVAIFSKTEPQSVRMGFGDDEFEAEGRYIEADFQFSETKLTVASLYLPKGATVEEDEPKYRRKMRFLASFSRFLQSHQAELTAAGRHFLLLGDFNIAHENLDLKNWKSNQKNEGFLPEERAWFSEQLASGEIVDVIRKLHPQTPGPYSWWSWRGQAFTNDAGWRIDYHLATRKLADLARCGGTDRAADYQSRMSDHAPVVVDYDI